MSDVCFFCFFFMHSFPYMQTMIIVIIIIIIIIVVLLVWVCVCLFVCSMSTNNSVDGRHPNIRAGRRAGKKIGRRAGEQTRKRVYVFCVIDNNECFDLVTWYSVNLLVKCASKVIVCIFTSKPFHNSQVWICAVRSVREREIFLYCQFLLFLFLLLLVVSFR